MVPGADAITDAVSDQLADLKEQTSTLVACTVARAMIRGCYRALEQTYGPSISNLPLEDWVLDGLRQEGLVVHTVARN
jgi:hypothetical protein